LDRRTLAHVSDVMRTFAGVAFYVRITASLFGCCRQRFMQRARWFARRVGEMIICRLQIMFRRDGLAVGDPRANDVIRIVLAQFDLSRAAEIVEKSGWARFSGHVTLGQDIQLAFLLRTAPRKSKRTNHNGRG
jgi:hypothetical protein